MRQIPPQFQQSLDSGASTMARCWLVTRADGVRLGFTDHDLDLTFDGITFEPETGFAPSAIEASTGLSPDSHDVTGALSSDRITGDDIARGLYSGAEVTLFLVDWQNVDDRVLLSRGAIGEIRRGDIAFEAEITGLADRLNQPVGRAYLTTCDCRAGEVRCFGDPEAPENKGAGTVLAATDPQQIAASGLGAYAPGWFNHGLLVWTSGANAGVESHVKAHLVVGEEALIDLWLAPPLPVQTGDGFEITVGCPRTAEECLARFGSLENFRGFPHIPGDDVAAAYPSTGDVHDGGSLFR
ncbi:MAG: DUF2163 domain-containing protein [Pseudomonadota bacterium]